MMASSAIAVTYDAIPPSFRIATRTVRYDEIIVRNTFVECDLEKKTIVRPDIGRFIFFYIRRRQDSSWVACLYAQALQGMRASADLLVRSTLETPHGGRSARTDSVLSYLNSCLIRDAGTAAPSQGRTHKNTPVELEDACIYFCS
jgi:hypothetical protein